MSAGKQKRKQQRKQQKAQQSTIAAEASKTDAGRAVGDPLTAKPQDELGKTIRTRAWSFIPSCILALLRLNPHYQREISIGLVCSIAISVLVVFSSWANFAPSQKRQRWILLAASTLAICGLLWWFTVPAAQTVTITPTEITFKQQWDSYPFIIANGLDEDVYEVIVKLAYGVAPDEFKMDVPPSSSQPIGNEQNGHKAGDVTGMSCRTQQGTFATFITIYHMAPKERREVTFARTKPGAAEVKTRVTYFSTESREYRSGPHFTAQQIMVDEPCTPVQLTIEFK